MWIYHVQGGIHTLWGSVQSKNATAKDRAKFPITTNSMATQVKEQPRKKWEPLFWNPLASWIGYKWRTSIKAYVKCLLNMTRQDQPRAEIDATHSAPTLHGYTKLWLAPCYIQASQQSGEDSQQSGEHSFRVSLPLWWEDGMLSKAVVGMERPSSDRGTR